MMILDFFLIFYFLLIYYYYHKYWKVELSENDRKEHTNDYMQSCAFGQTIHSDPFRVSSRVAQEAQEEKKKNTNSPNTAGWKVKRAPPPTTVRTHFRLGLHVKSHSPGVIGGWRGIHCFGMGQWVCVIKKIYAVTRARLLDQVSP